MRALKLLFLHRNFPAQFKHLLVHFQRNTRVELAFITENPRARMDRVLTGIYELKKPVSDRMHQYLPFFEESIRHGQGAARVAMKLRNRGFVPDLIVGHSWGPISFLKDVFPKTPLIGYFEWFYRAENSDIDFGKTSVDLDTKARARMKNAHILVDLSSADHGLVPTHWQKSQFPALFHPKLACIHDGVDTRRLVPLTESRDLVLASKNIRLPAGTKIVTYVARGKEPYRGFPQFMEAVALLLQRRTDFHVLVVGSDRICYGAQLPDNQNYRDLMLSKFAIDQTRVHFTGVLEYTDFVRVLQASTVHVYLTVPFVLSWSMLEAMSCGALIVGSKTPPVEEVITSGQNGLLVDFFSPSQLADQVGRILDNPGDYAALRKAARDTILDRYDLAQCLKQQIALMEQIRTQ